MKRKIAKRIDADLQLVADVEALMHGIAGLARLDGVADHVDGTNALSSSDSGSYLREPRPRTM